MENPNSATQYSHPTKAQLVRGRYRKEDEHIVIDVAVKNSRQLFNERDPAPFRDRDLDEDFVDYILSSVQEFPLKTPMKIDIVIQEESPVLEQNILHEAIKSYFVYAAKLAQVKLQQRLKVSRLFFCYRAPITLHLFKR